MTKQPITPAQRGALGGAVKASESPAKAAALRRLHASRKGVRQHAASRDRKTVLADIATAIREPVRGVRSLRAVAAYCKVDARTMGRWLSGEDWPPPTQVRRLGQWLRTFAP